MSACVPAFKLCFFSLYIATKLVSTNGLTNKIRFSSGSAHNLHWAGSSDLVHLVMTSSHVGGSTRACALPSGLCSFSTSVPTQVD